MRSKNTSTRERAPIILIKGEGITESNYLKSFNERNVINIRKATGNKTDPEGMLDELIEYMQEEAISPRDFGDKVFLLVDVDLSDIQVDHIMKILDKCKKNDVELITSNPTFEIWFLMYSKKSDLVFKDSKSVKEALKKIIKGYTPGNITNEKDIPGNRKDAINYALSIDAKLGKYKEKIKHNPHCDMYKFFECIEDIKKRFSK